MLKPKKMLRTLRNVWIIRFRYSKEYLSAINLNDTIGINYTADISLKKAFSFRELSAADDMANSIGLDCCKVLRAKKYIEC